MGKSTKDRHTSLNISFPNFFQLFPSTWFKGATRQAVAASILAAYTESTALKHYRCTKDGQPVCRPDMTVSTSEIECARGEVQMTNTPVTQFSTLGDCLDSLYV